MNDDQIIGVNLRMLRKIYHETQEGLGEILGLNKSAICAYEKGERALDTQKLQLYANHYRKSIDEFVHGNLTSPELPYFKQRNQQIGVILTSVHFCSGMFGNGSFRIIGAISHPPKYIKPLLPAALAVCEYD